MDTFGYYWADILYSCLLYTSGEPLGSDGHVASVQHVLEDGLVLRVLVAYFAAVKTSELHLRDALLEGVLVAEIPHIIIGRCV